MKTFRGLTIVAFLEVFLFALISIGSVYAYTDQYGTGIAGDTCLTLQSTPNNPIDEGIVHGKRLSEGVALEHSVEGEVFGYKTDMLKPAWNNLFTNPIEYPIPETEVIDLKSLNTAYTDRRGIFHFNIDNPRDGVALVHLKNPDFYVVDNLHDGVALKRYGIRSSYDFNLTFPNQRYEEYAVTNTYDVLYEVRDSLKEAGWDVLQTSHVVNSFPVCNAYYFPFQDTTHFGLESVCQNAAFRSPNTAYSTVIAHEYGHAVVDTYVDFCFKCNFTDLLGYHEGFADTVSSVTLQTECVGDEFLGQNEGCLRNVSEVWTYPVQSYAHDRGRPISGTFWDIYEEIGKEKTLDLIMYVIKENTVNRFDEAGFKPEILRELLHEGDLIFNNGQNHELIENALVRHGL